MESVLGSVFIKITELLSGKLIETLLSKKGKKRKALLGLFSDINALEPLIEDLIRELLANGTEILHREFARPRRRGESAPSC